MSLGEESAWGTHTLFQYFGHDLDTLISTHYHELELVTSDQFSCLTNIKKYKNVFDLQVRFVFLLLETYLILLKRQIYREKERQRRSSIHWFTP